MDRSYRPRVYLIVTGNWLRSRLNSWKLLLSRVPFLSQGSVRFFLWFLEMDLRIAVFSLSLAQNTTVQQGMNHLYLRAISSNVSGLKSQRRPNVWQGSWQATQRELL